MPSESLTIEHDLGPTTGMVEEITMSRKKLVAKKRPEEVRVNWIVDLVDPPQPVAEPAEPEPEPDLEPDPHPDPDPDPKEEWLSGVSQHLAHALKMATAECARLATDRVAAEARVRELEGVLKQIDSIVSSALPKGDGPTEGNGGSDQ
jgi:hypothetical protein